MGLSIVNNKCHIYIYQLEHILHFLTILCLSIGISESSTEAEGKQVTPLKQGHSWGFLDYALVS